MSSNPIIRKLAAIPVGFAFAAILITILTLTLMPSNGVPSVSIPHIDKAVHFLMFGALSCALLYDLGRHHQSISASLWLISAVIATAVGGGIELLQDAMRIGRSAEWADLIADAAGAFILPLPFLRLLSSIVTTYSLSLSSVGSSRKIPAHILNIYLQSFPEDERRPWESIESLIDTPDRYRFTLIRSAGKAIGFISWWHLPTAIYIEHFAIDPSRRSDGLGSKALQLFCAKLYDNPIVLEVEPEGSTPMAARRIAFYQRCGFTPRPELPYIQPPYTPESSPVPLMLMTAGHVSELNHTAREIKKYVYSQ